jgi:hypothetical protein
MESNYFPLRSSICYVNKTKIFIPACDHLSKIINSFPTGGIFDALTYIQ